VTGRCKDCKHWNAAGLEWPWALGFTPQGWRLCDRTDNGCRTPAASARQSLALAQDAEMYHAWLMTAPDFGCVQFEELTRPPPGSAADP